MFDFNVISAELDYLDDMAERYNVLARNGDINSVEILNKILELMKLLKSLKELECQNNLKQ